jgi:LSD1 subclass zinc finger protein
MTDEEAGREGTYRCPVCGHRDSAVLPGGRESAVIRCSYCRTALDVQSRGADSIRLRVQVSEQEAAR